MNLLIFGCEKQCRNSDKLKPCPHDLSLFQIAIDQINGEKECFWLQFKAQVHLDDPIYENASHFLIDIDLHAHVALRGACQVLLRKHVTQDSPPINLSIIRSV